MLYAGREYFIFGRRSSGYFDIRTFDGVKVNKGSISHKKLKLLEASKHYITIKKDDGLTMWRSSYD